MDLYARLSFAANGETIKVDDQIEMGVDEVERRGGVVGETFRDNSLSAWNPKIVRPDWNMLMARLESGASDGVWVYNITRFSRKVMEGERLVELAAMGIRVWSHAGEYDLTTADGRRHFRESMAPLPPSRTRFPSG
jgi:site-specific DNA recombinase